MTRLVALLALLAGACASASPATITYSRSPSHDGQTPPSPNAQEQGSAGRRAAPPATQPNWADGEGAPLSAYALQPSAGIDPARMPPTHRVSGDESLYDIATRYQVPMLALIDQNHLEPPYALSEGRVLALPPPRFHVVRRGEELQDLARRYNIDLRSLALLNRIEPDARLGVGDRIYLPALAVERPPLANAGEAPSPQVLGRGAARFGWPLRGEVVARFGAQPGGTRLDGIEIAGREGAQVVAAAEGDVIYAGADIEGLGTLVLVRHEDNYVTAYGYTRSALAREGQHVRAGEVIAELGARPDGRVRLLFQVRRGSEALDPAPLMGVPR